MSSRLTRIQRILETLQQHGFSLDWCWYGGETVRRGDLEALMDDLTDMEIRHRIIVTALRRAKEEIAFLRSTGDE